MDYRKKDTFPLPKIDTCLDLLNGSQYFSSCDLRWGYWQTTIAEEDRYKTALCSKAAQATQDSHGTNTCPHGNRATEVTGTPKATGAWNNFQDADTLPTGAQSGNPFLGLVSSSDSSGGSSPSLLRGLTQSQLPSPASSETSVGPTGAFGTIGNATSY